MAEGIFLNKKEAEKQPLYFDNIAFRLIEQHPAIVSGFVPLLSGSR